VLAFAGVFAVSTALPAPDTMLLFSRALGSGGRTVGTVAIGFGFGLGLGLGLGLGEHQHPPTVQQRLVEVRARRTSWFGRRQARGLGLGVHP